MAISEDRADASISPRARRAEAEARGYIDRLTDRQGAAAEERFAALSPEARLLVARAMARTSSMADPVERVRFEVSQLMSEGRATLHDLVRDISSMSPEGRRYAFQVLMAHPEYRVKGSRWHGGPYRVDEYASPSNPGGYTSYQILVDSLRELVGSSEGVVRAAANDTWVPVRWSEIQDAARADRNQGVRAAVLRVEERFRRGLRGPTAWFFSDGGWAFVALLDGRLVGATPDRAVELPAGAMVSVKTTTSGTFRSVTIGSAMMLYPRPESEVERFLALAEASGADTKGSWHRLPALEGEPVGYGVGPESPLVMPPSRGPAEGEVSAGAGSVRDALVQLEDLRSTGLVTEQEYAAKRTEILGRL